MRYVVRLLLVCGMAASMVGCTGYGMSLYEVGGPVVPGFSPNWSGRTFHYQTAVGMMTRGVIVGGETDLWRFDAMAGQRVAFATDLGGSGLDSVITLYDGAGRVLAFDDDSGPGLASYLEYTFGWTGTYYLGVRPYGFTRGPYGLILSGR